MGLFAAVCSLLVEVGSGTFHSKISLSLSPASDKAEEETDPERLPVGFVSPHSGALMSGFILLSR